MSSSSRKLLALIVSFLPLGALRRFGYSCMGYRLGAGTKIGLGAVIAVDSFTCGANVTIGRKTSFIGPMIVSLGERTFIGKSNRFECSQSVVDPKNAHMNYERTFETGTACLIHEDHLFDVYGRISIGAGSWIAGAGSQFFTHGASVMDRNIRIGSECYIGSATRFAPGAGVGDRVMVGMGAVVTKALPENDVVIAGVPARVIKARDADDYHFEKNWS